jgi:Concanavalin A-like lectin/glucanases superfamily
VRNFRKTPPSVRALVMLVAYACAPNYDLLKSGSLGAAGASGGRDAPAGSAGSGLGDAGADDVAGQGGRLAQGGTTSAGASNAGMSAWGGSIAGASGAAIGGAGAGGGASAGTDGVAGSLGGNGGNAGAIEEPTCAVAGKAFRFDSNGFADTVRVIQDDFTIEAWLKTTASRSGQYFWQGDPIAWADSTQGGAHDFGMSVLNTQLFVNTGEPDITTFSSSSISTGKWVHMAVTRRKATGATQIFINGILEATNGGNTATLDSVSTLSLGCSPNRDAFFDGLIDEVRLWQIVRSSSEIKGTMHQVLSGSEAGLVAYYRFDQLTGNKIPDSSGHGNDATAYGTNYVDALVTSNAPVCDPVSGGGGGGGGGGASGGSGGASGGIASGGLVAGAGG